MAPRHLGEHRVAQAGGLQRAVALRNRAAPAMGEKLVRVIQGRPSPDLVHLRTLAGRAVELVQLGGGVVADADGARHPLAPEGEELLPHLCSGTARGQWMSHRST